MSLVLGKIHYWLYDKICWYEGIEEDILKWAKAEGLHAEDWYAEFCGAYGEPTEKKPLEEVVDTANIHGWLQDKIRGAELRQAALITRILNARPEYKENIIEIYKKHGKTAAEEFEVKDLNPQEIYALVNNYILEGMPCDRVELELSNTSDEYAWKLTKCLHKQYWDKADGDVEIFYILRAAWIKAFVESLNPNFSYQMSDENVHRIYKTK